MTQSQSRAYLLIEKISKRITITLNYKFSMHFSNAILQIDLTAKKAMLTKLGNGKIYEEYIVWAIYWQVSRRGVNPF
jgi:hypothetical protein